MAMSTEPDPSYSVPGACPGWAEYGDRRGIPLLYHHGMPGAHPEAALLDRSARAQGFRIIVPDRPGIGLTPNRGLRAVSDLVQDHCRLLDQLGVDRCHQAGWSSGGPHALAMAALAPQRVRGVTLMASYTHFSEVAEGGPAPAPPIALEDRLPALLTWLTGLIGWTQRLLPWVYLRSFQGLCAPVDRNLLRQSSVRNQFMAAQRQAFSQGMAGPRQDLALQSRDWGFRLAQVTAPVRLYQGLQDPFVSPEHSEHLRLHLGRCNLVPLVDEAHLFPLREAFQNLWFKGLRDQLERADVGPG